MDEKEEVVSRALGVIPIGAKVGPKEGFNSILTYIYTKNGWCHFDGKTVGPPTWCDSFTDRYLTQLYLKGDKDAEVG